MTSVHACIVFNQATTFFFPPSIYIMRTPIPTKLFHQCYVKAAVYIEDNTSDQMYLIIDWAASFFATLVYCAYIPQPPYTSTTNGAHIHPSSAQGRWKKTRVVQGENIPTYGQSMASEKRNL